MKRKLFFSVIFTLLVLLSLAQVININPDPNGDPWTLGPGNSLGDLGQEMTVNPDALSMILASVNNAQLDYFHGIFNQSPSPTNLYNSCAQASGITYTFGYEINRLKNANATYVEHQYPQCFTWNYFNGNINLGSEVDDGWEIVMDNGCPNMLVWSKSMHDDKYWMSDYEQYESGAWNRIDEVGFYLAHASNGIDAIKTWLSNHNDPQSTSGGLGVFVKNMDYFGSTQLGPGPHYPDVYITEWGTSGKHAMTIVGYDDGVNCTPTNQGYGAFLVANSWGPWANNGYIWLPYDLADNLLRMDVLKVVDHRQPQIMARIKIKHEHRNKIRIGIHISDNPWAIAPSEIEDYSKVFYAMDYDSHNYSYGGGELPLNGSTNEFIEIGYDLSDFIELNYPNQPVPNLKFILGVKEDDPSGIASGEILDFSIIDYRTDPNDPFEVYDHNESKAISNNTITEGV